MTTITTTLTAAQISALRACVRVAASALDNDDSPPDITAERVAVAEEAIEDIFCQLVELEAEKTPGADLDGVMTRLSEET